jgi:hypothetical protein
MNKAALAILVIIVLTCTFCTSTKITSSWREPDKLVTMDKLHKVLIVALFKDETNSRKAEDQMFEYLEGKGVVSYSYLNAKINKKNEEYIRTKIKADGFDGAVTMRLIDVDKDKTYIPGSIATYPMFYRNFSGYYSRTWMVNSAPGYYATTRTYIVEVNVYSIKEDKIIWTGITESTNPDAVKKMTAEIAKVIYKKMLQEGFIGKKRVARVPVNN